MDSNFLDSMKRTIISFLSLIFFLFSISAQTAGDAVNKFVRQSGVNPNSIAVKIIDLKDGSTLASHNSSVPLIPASIMKAVTTATLLGETGPDWRYHTRVYIDGPNDLGFMRGNLIITGACDPSLHSEHEPFSTDLINEIAEALSSLRIREIEGTVIIDETEFSGSSRPASWAAGDQKKYYGTGSHAFNFEDNARGDFSVENPSFGFVSQLKESLKEKGIVVSEKDISEGPRIQILDHLSFPIDEIMRSCMMRSDNMFAESMLRTYGKIAGGTGSTDDSADLVTKLWSLRNLPMEGIMIVDGSGLSRNNRMTADFMGALLEKMSDNPDYASFFPLAGQEGTLKKFLAETPLDSYIAMKTGSMKGIQCYAGYKLDDDYVPTHVVVIMINDIIKSRENAKKAAENMLLTVFSES